MTVPVFVDTNILVYARDASEPTKQAAAEQWMSYLRLEQRGRISTQVLGEFYTRVSPKLHPGLSRDEAWRDVSALLAG
jgi:predicted nucleic acid-binding protein